jgi:peptide/nickel transport system permease protein
MIFRLIITRIASGLLTLLVVSLIIFTATQVLPGDVAARALGRFATPEMIQAFHLRLHLDRPLPEQYLLWLEGAVRLDFGKSLINDIEVRDIVSDKLINTFKLGLFALILYVPISLVFATVSAVYRDKPIDMILSVLTLVGLSLPEFVSGTLLLFTFAVFIPLFPAMSVIELAGTPTEVVRTLALPAVTLAIAMSVYAIRMLRDNLIEVLNAEYIRMAVLKGLPRYRVILWHALPNALVPTLNVTALNLAYLIGGVVVVETIFGYNGIGSLLVSSIFFRDAPTIEATALLVSAVYILANLFSDVMAILLTPRLRTG